MGVDKPGPGEELNTGAATTPREAATVIVLRGGGEALEVLLVKRNPKQRFMGGAWVFPGGAVDADEDSRVAGVREVAEEAAVALPDAEALIEFSRWITPAEVTIRFDTRFYLVAAPAGAEPRVDGTGCARGLRARGAAARVPDHQDAGAAVAVRVRRRAARLGGRP
jgi:8-oxo-dGTP pyrophosphatase MutT (NUDIX family)